MIIKDNKVIHSSKTIISSLLYYWFNNKAKKIPVHGILIIFMNTIHRINIPGCSHTGTLLV